MGAFPSCSRFLRHPPACVTVGLMTARKKADKKRLGTVYLVGAGPGDISLLTVKGLRCLEKADVVVYDFHVNAQVLNFVRGDAEFVYAGKRGGHHAMAQD